MEYHTYDILYNNMKGLIDYMKLVKNNDTFRGVLESINEEYKGTMYPFAMSGLSLIGYMSSRRGTMFTSNLSQFKTLINPEIPNVFTGMENITGKYSSGYKKIDSDMEVYAIIKKFDDPSIPEQYNNYRMILYDKKKDKYNMVTRNSVKKLTENYGYRYNNSTIDSLNVGDKVKKDTVLYKSTSYDEDMNYRYGLNVTTMHMLDPFDAEDAVIISETLSKTMTTIDVTKPMASVNDNDLLLNLYGNQEEYKTFPDIGEEVHNSILMARKRIHNDRLLYDLKMSELMNVSFLNNKIVYGSGRVIDIDIFSNKKIEDFPNTPYNRQIIKYLKMQDRYYRELRDVLDDIINSGSDYDNDISYYYKRACDYLNDNYKFKDRDGSIYSNFKIQFTLEKVNELYTGQKLVGRYGNKGVVSIIRPDDEMPVLDNGIRVDLILNSFSPTNRLISAPLYELTINFMGNRLGEYFENNELTLHEKEELFFDVLGTLSPREAKAVRKYYDKLDLLKQEAFFKSVSDYGMFVEAPVLWEGDDPLYDKIDRLYDRYPHIFKPYDVYVKKHGYMHKIMGKHTGYVGSMYMIALKHSAFKDYASRSIGSINSKELPAKTDSAKKHQDLYPRTPIKLGYQETINLLVAINSRVYSEINMLYRSSVKGRRDIGEKLLIADGPIEDMDFMDQYVNRNVEILNAYMKAMGLQLTFHDNIKYVNAYDNTVGAFTTPSGRLLVGTKNDYINKAIRDRLEDVYSNDIALITKSSTERERIILEEIEEMKNKMNGVDIDE